MNNEQVQIELGRGWPEQVIADHAPYWRKWREQNPLPQISEKIYVNVAKHWIPFANGKNLGPKLMLEWNEYCLTRMRELGAATNFVMKWHQRVRAYLRWLMVMGVITVDPGVALKSPSKPPSKPKKIFTHEEYRKLVERAPTQTIAWLLVLGYHTGMSLVDCCTLEWDEVKLPESGPCYIQRIRSKMHGRHGTRATATIPVLPGGELWVWLKRIEKYRDLGPVSVDACESYHDGSLNWALVQFFKNDERSFQHLRNSFCSRLINSGTDAVLVSKMTGHSSLTQLADYVAPDIESMQNAVLRGLRYAESGSTLPSRAVLPSQELPQAPTSLASDTGGAAIN